MIDDIQFRIGISPRTPILVLFRLSTCWRVWTAVRDMQAPYSQWQGTYLDLFDDQSVTRTTVYDDGTEDVIHVKS